VSRQQFFQQLIVFLVQQFAAVGRDCPDAELLVPAVDHPDTEGDDRNVGESGYGSAHGGMGCKWTFGSGAESRANLLGHVPDRRHIHLSLPDPSFYARDGGGGGVRGHSFKQT